MNKPIGLWIWTIFHILNAAGLLLLSLFSLALGKNIITQFFALGTVGVIVIIFLSMLLSIFIVVGFFTRKVYGYWANLGYLGFGLLVNVWFLLIVQKLSNLANVVILSLMGYYIYKKKEYYNS